MKRSMVRDPERELANILFGTGATETRIPQLAKATKIPKSTIYRDKENPMKIPAERFIKYAKARGINLGEITL